MFQLTPKQSHRAVRQSVATVGLLLPLLMITVGATLAQSTTGEPGLVDRLQIQYLSMRLEPVIDIRPTGSEFMVEAVPLRERGKYLVTAWFQNVPYYWDIKGQKLMTETTTLHVFETTDNLDTVSISGLTILFRKGSSLVNLEYMIRLENNNQPQRTVLGTGHTFALTLPVDAGNIAATYDRGPEPLPVPVTKLGDGRVGLQVPLTAGSTQVRVTANLPWQDSLEFPVGSNLAIADWGFMVSPPGGAGHGVGA